MEVVEDYIYRGPTASAGALPFAGLGASEQLTALMSSATVGVNDMSQSDDESDPEDYDPEEADFKLPPCPQGFDEEQYRCTLDALRRYVRHHARKELKQSEEDFERIYMPKYLPTALRQALLDRWRLIRRHMYLLQRKVDRKEMEQKIKEIEEKQEDQALSMSTGDSELEHLVFKLHLDDGVRIERVVKPKQGWRSLAEAIAADPKVWKAGPWFSLCTVSSVSRNVHSNRAEEGQLVPICFDGWHHCTLRETGEFIVRGLALGYCRDIREVNKESTVCFSEPLLRDTGMLVCMDKDRNLWVLLPGMPNAELRNSIVPLLMSVSYLAAGVDDAAAAAKRPKIIGSQASSSSSPSGYKGSAASTPMERDRLYLYHCSPQLLELLKDREETLLPRWTYNLEQFFLYGDEEVVVPAETIEGQPRVQSYRRYKHMAESATTQASYLSTHMLSRSDWNYWGPVLSSHKCKWMTVSCKNSKTSSASA